MKIKPIEICKDLTTLRDRERHWIRELNTLYPYGLNDRYAKDAFLHVTSGYPRPALLALNRKNIEKMFLYCNMSTNINIDSPVTPFLSLAVKYMCMYKINSITRIKHDKGKKRY